MEGILIPVKRMDRAKRRLSASLTQQERVQLNLAMLADILNATANWQARLVVTPDARASELVRSLGADIVHEQEAGLNAALALGTKHAVARGIERLLVLPADVPAVAEADLRLLFHRREQVLVASSTDGGTTALLRSPADAMETAFGPNSAEAHMDAALAAGLQARHVELESLTLDVDDLSDLHRLASIPLDRQSVALARKLLNRQQPPPA